jgi:hypothetical protein
MALRIEDFGGSYYAATTAEVENALAKRYGSGVNEVWLSHEGHKFPALSIVVNGELASLNYFPEEDHPGFVSSGNIDGMNQDGYTTFYINTPSEKHEVWNGAVVSLQTAVAASKEFLHNEQLPPSIEWSEL